MRVIPFTFHFKDGFITVEACNIQKAKQLAMNEANKRGWDPNIVPLSNKEIIQVINNGSNKQRTT